MELTSIIRESMLKAISYETYRNLIDKYEAEGKSSGVEQTEELIHYTALNQKRYKRLDKTIEIAEDKAAFFKNYPNSICLLVITETWCGDAAQILPVVHKIAELNPKITMKIVFRDENVLARWGSRPSVATQMVAEEKAKNGKLTPEFKEDLQRWYNQDKGATIVDDFIAIMQSILTEK